LQDRHYSRRGGYAKIAGSTRSLQLILRSDWLYARIRIARSTRTLQLILRSDWLYARIRIARSTRSLQSILRSDWLSTRIRILPRRLSKNRGINPLATRKCGRRGGHPSRCFASQRIPRIDYRLEGYRLDVRCWCYAGIGTMPLQCSHLPACCACGATGLTPGFVSSDVGYSKIAGSTRTLQLILRSDWLYARIRIARSTRSLPGNADDAAVIPPVYPPAGLPACGATGLTPGFVSRDKPARYNRADLSRDQPARYNPFCGATGFTPGFVSSHDGYSKIAG